MPPVESYHPLVERTIKVTSNVENHFKTTQSLGRISLFSWKPLTPCRVFFLPPYNLTNEWNPETVWILLTIRPDLRIKKRAVSVSFLYSNHFPCYISICIHSIILLEGFFFILIYVTENMLSFAIFPKLTFCVFFLIILSKNYKNNVLFISTILFKRKIFKKLNVESNLNFLMYLFILMFVLSVHYKTIANKTFFVERYWYTLFLV